MADQSDTAVTSQSAPLATGARIFCFGRNYATHRDELRSSETPWPEVFLRLPTAAAAGDADIVVPAASSQFDYEGELGVVIGRGGRNIPAAEGAEYVGGLCVVNDFTARDWQWRGKQWTPGKNFDATLPVSRPVDAAGIDWSDLIIETRLNGEIVQSDRTSSLIFDVPTQIEFISTWTRLNPGDLICTGTPGGVGAARRPPVWLSPGDLVEVSVAGVGSIANRLIADGSRLATGAWAELANG